ncbi:hypothetical protein GCM10027514_05130 [Azotobacter armeniacus]
MDFSVSIVVCNYNYEKFIASAVESALSQTIEPLEVIVIDDGSTDNSLERLNHFKGNPRFHLHTKKNGGQISAYNTGFILAKGDIIIFLDSDDLLTSNAIEHIVEAFQDESVVKVHWYMRLIDKFGSSTGGTIPSALDNGEQGRRLLNQGVLYNSAPGSGNAYRRSALEKLFPLPQDKHDRHGADFFTIYGASLVGRVLEVNKTLGAYRIHACKEDIRGALAFGNAAKSADESSLVRRRSSRFQHWIEERLHLRFTRSRFIDFSMLKSEYAITVMGERWGLKRLRAAITLFPPLRRSIRARKDFGWVKRTALYVWATLIPILPSGLAHLLAAWASNPGTRPRLFHKG